MAEIPAPYRQPYMQRWPYVCAVIADPENQNRHIVDEVGVEPQTAFRPDVDRTYEHTFHRIGRELGIRALSVDNREKIPNPNVIVYRAKPTDVPPDTLNNKWRWKVVEYPRLEDEEDDQYAERVFAAILDNADPKDFTERPSYIPWPIETYRDIFHKCIKYLSPTQIAEYWNTSIEELVAKKAVHPHFTPVSVGRLFSELLVYTMTDESAIEITIPPSLDGKLMFMGSRLERGKLIIHGNVGDFTGTKMKGNSVLEINGSVGKFAAAGADTSATLIVNNS